MSNLSFFSYLNHLESTKYKRYGPLYNGLKLMGKYLKKNGGYI